MSKMDKQLDDVDWKLMKSKRETPCCGQSVRVKIVEPGPQMRKCQLCKAVNWFVLEPSLMFPDRLKMRWMSDRQVEAMREAQEDELSDVDVGEL